jgi:hypothetical protein
LRVKLESKRERDVSAEASSSLSLIDEEKDDQFGF